MPEGVGITIFMMAVYTVFIVGIGWWSTKFAKKSLEDYAMASRELRVWVLFGRDFGANISAVTLIGIPGTAYHAGWVAWPYFVSAWAWGTPFLFYVLGGRATLLPRSLRPFPRWSAAGGRARGWLAIAIFLVHTIPYLMTGLRRRRTSTEIKGVYTYWLGAAGYARCFITSWRSRALLNNTFQTAVFLIGGVVIFLIVAYAGGPAQATANLPTQATRIF